MLLRRITQNIKDQNWTAVVLDLFIVVFGVFIGIQVSNWNEARNEAVREQQVLLELLDDLREDAAMLAAASEAAQLTIDAANIVLQAAELKPLTQVSLPVSNPYSNDEIAMAPPKDMEAYQTSAFWTDITLRYYPEQNDAALNALIAAGNFSIVKDRQIVRDLQRYKTFWNNVVTSHNFTYRPGRDQAIIMGHKHGLSPFSEVDLAALVEIVRSDPEMQGGIRTMAGSAAFHRQSLNGLLGEAQGLIKRIEAATASS